MYEFQSLLVFEYPLFALMTVCTRAAMDSASGCKTFFNQIHQTVA